MTPTKDCLPIAQVLDTVLRVERDVAGFYRSAADRTNEDEVKRLFDGLHRVKQDNHPELEKVCREIECGDRAFENATEKDVHFLSAMAETSFYRQTGKVSELADPSLQTPHLLENALKLEKDLLLFYMKFYGMSCSAHRPLFSRLIETSQQHIAELNNVATRLGSRR